MRIKHEILNVRRFEGFRLVDIYCYYMGISSLPYSLGKKQ